MLTWWEGSIELGHGVGEYVIADSAYRTVRRVQAARGLHGDLHEFVLTPRDTALLTSYVVTNADLAPSAARAAGTIQDAIFQEIDLATGAVLLEWHSLDHVALEESYAPVSADWDFCHLNSVDLDRDGNLLVSSRSTHTIYKIDRERRRSSGVSAASAATSRWAPAATSPGSTTRAASPMERSRSSTTARRRRSSGARAA